MLLLIDNYDSFTYNLVQLLQQESLEPDVLRNDDPRLLDLALNSALEGVVISPGPGAPQHSGLCPNFLRLLSSQVPVLGVCLGHQILAHHAGWPVIRAPRIMHGKTSSIEHAETGIFQGLPRPFTATRYHSLLMDPDYQGHGRSLLSITAWSQTGEPMGLAYQDRDWFGIQFHPESILTQQGPGLMRNFLRLTLQTQDA
ncbi:MAG: anthranilate synthase component II [Desulfohalobiaceae bacterium]